MKKMKIAHTGDIHWGLGYPGPAPDSRFKDICLVADLMADRIIQEECDLVLVAGDLFKDARVFLDRASVEITAAVKWLRRFSEVDIPVIVISGTPGHDAIAAYKLIQEMRIPKVSIFTSPGIKEVRRGELIISVACIPGINRSTIASKEELSKLSVHELHQLITERVTELTLGLAAQCEHRPRILLSHITAAGADRGFEDLLQQQEPVLTKASIEGAGFDLVCLGHIHKMQQVEGLTVPTFYCGSPERLSFNEETHNPGFLLHYFGGDETLKYRGSDIINTPARRYWSLELPWSDEDPDAVVDVLNSLEDSLTGVALELSAKDAIVRVRYEVTEAQAKLINQAKIIRDFYDLGAYYVQGIEARVRRIARSRAADATTELKSVDAIKMWGEVNQIDAAELAELIARAESLEQEVGI